ncbi:MAG: hypothetical protein IJ109_04355 [Firmicutes bacterium]|nr:hypothetical protein [Bacillota bacterium]
MTRKLVNFEFRSSFRLLVVIWAALLAMTVLMCILLKVTGLDSYQEMISSGQALEVITGIVHVVSWILYVALFSALVVLTIAIVIARFYRGLLGEEGYLMHTLPVKEWQLITAKGITATCAVAGSILVGIISIVLVANVGNLFGIFEGLADIGKAIGQEPLLLLLGIEFLILTVLGILKSIYQIYASISIGQLSGRHRILSSVGAYIGITIVLSILAGIIVFAGAVSGIGESLGLWFEAHSAIITEDGISGFGPSQLVLLLAFLAEAIQLAAFHVVSERLLTKRLNLL